MTMSTNRAALFAAAAGVTLGAVPHALHADAPAPAGPAAGGPLDRIPIEQRTLPNGLRVVLSPDHTAPTVAVAIYYDVGSRNEERGRSGFAHLFEHMMFQGSENVGKGEHFQYVINRGGSCNGTTSEDRTNYFETLPSNELELAIWLEADRLRSLAVTQANFENQRQTVMEERRQRYDNQPYVSSFIRINELSFQGYWPYEHSTIGSMEDLQRAPIAAVQEFFRTYYAPNNAVLAIAGDFEVDHAIQLVERHFGPIPRRETPAFRDPGFSPQAAERTERLGDALAQLPAFHVAYHVPRMGEADHYALEILASILGDGDSSRLYQDLVKRREVVQSISVGVDNRRGPDLFSFWAILAEGHTGAEVRPLLYAALADVAQNGVTPRELEKSRNRVRSHFIFGLQSNIHRATDLAEYALYFGDPTLLRTEISRYLAVDQAALRRVAGQYFAATNRTVLDVVPEAQPAGAAAAAAHPQGH